MGDQVNIIAEAMHIDTLRRLAASDNGYTGNRRTRKPMEDWLSEKYTNLDSILTLLNKSELADICYSLDVSPSGNITAIVTRLKNTLSQESSAISNNAFLKVEPETAPISNKKNKIELVDRVRSSETIQDGRQNSRLMPETPPDRPISPPTTQKLPNNTLASVSITNASMSTSKTLTAIAVTAATAAVGASVGRDLYKGLKKENPSIKFVAIAVILSGWVGYDIARGVEGSFGYKLFRYYILNLVLIVLLAFMTSIVASGKPNIFTFMQVALFLIGVLLGLKKRSERKAYNKVVLHNAVFLNKIGLKDVGGREQTFIDRDGNELVLHDVREDAIILRFLNRRGGRSKLNLDDSRRITEYFTDARSV